MRPELAQRIAIIGPLGSGKTPLAQQLGQKLGWPHVELDALYWSSGWKPVSPEAFREHTLQALRGETWVVDGNHPEVWDIVCGRAELLVWLNYSPWQVVRQQVQQIRQRIVHGDNLEDEQPTTPAIVSRNSIFLQVVRTFRHRQDEYPIVLSLRGMKQLPPKVIHLDSPGSTQRWLSEFVEAQERQVIVERL